ncbi:MAG: translation elongation factor Ts [Kiloniellales bacterium]|nr:translation elongation factor Ts [Kiloniellales bacterium]
MAQISAALVKELRDKTGAGMMDCKKALSETGGDVEEAIDWLRKKGVASAAKKAGRVAAEGLVGTFVEGNRGALVEINCETDFVARNEEFQGFVASGAKLALDAQGDVEALAGTAYPDGSGSVQDKLTSMIATIGENMNLRRTAVISVDQGVVASYVHNHVAPGLGKIGVLVGLESTADPERLQAVGRNLAMHIAFAAPQAVDVSSVSAATLERERNVLIEQARASGRPEEIIEKMVEGRLRKFYEEIVLLEQPYSGPPSQDIEAEAKLSKALDRLGKDLGGEVKVSGFARFQLGEGIEKA